MSYKIDRCWVRLEIDTPDCDLVFLLLDNTSTATQLKCIRAVRLRAISTNTARSLLEAFFDLRELDRCRELVLHIPITNANATHLGINVAISAIWNLRETHRHLLLLHRDGQRAFAKQSDEAEHKQEKKTAAQATSKIVGIGA